MRSLVDPLWLLLIILTIAIFANFKNTKINQSVKISVSLHANEKSVRRKVTGRTRAEVTKKMS